MKNVLSKYLVISFALNKSYVIDIFSFYRKMMHSKCYHLAVLTILQNNFMKNNQGGPFHSVVLFALPSPVINFISGTRWKMKRCRPALEKSTAHTNTTISRATLTFAQNIEEFVLKSFLPFVGE